MLLAQLLLLLPLLAWGNVFMHNPRGSNNRGCETNEGRTNVRPSPLLPQRHH